MATCDASKGGCGRRVVWGVSEKGKRAPIDPEPVPEGNVTVDWSKEPPVYHVLTKAEKASADAPGLFDLPPERYTLHFATCSRADHFRRDKVAHRDRPGRNR